MAQQRQYCEEHGKNCYDKRGAETVRNKRWKEDRVRLRLYPCPACRTWHVSEDDDIPPKRSRRPLP